MRENALETGNATREELIGLRKEADYLRKNFIDSIFDRRS